MGKILMNKWFKTMESKNYVFYTYDSLFLFPLADTKFELISYMDGRGYNFIERSNFGCTLLFRKRLYGGL